MGGPNTPSQSHKKGNTAGNGNGAATPVGLTPSQKRRLRKQKLEQRNAAGDAADSDADGAAAAATAATPTAAKPAAPATATPAVSAKKKGRKLEETPAFVPAVAVTTDDNDDEDDSDDSDSEAGNIITAANFDKKKSIAALSAKEVLRAAEEERRKQALLDGSDDDDDDEESLTINKAYAAKFEDEKRKQTLSKKHNRGDVLAQALRAAADEGEEDDELLGDVRRQLRDGKPTDGADAVAGDLASDDESAQSEDDDGELLTDGLNAQIDATLAAIRAKKPEVYDPKKAFFTEEQMEALKAQKKAERAAQQKKMGVKELMAKQLMEGDDSDDDDAALNTRSRLQKLADAKPLTYTEKQQQIKKEFLKSAKKSGNDDDDEEEEDDEEDVFKIKTKAEPMDVDDGADNEEFLMPASKNASGDSKASKFTTNGQGVNEANATDFLSSYLSGEWWKEKDLSKLPTYRDIKGEDLPPEVSDSEDEHALDDADTFEAAYNFRFQEPNAAYQIKSYPRPQLIQDSLRKEENTRKAARETAKKHKEEEKLKKKEEIARLKAEKKKELSKKMKELEEIAGLKDGTAAKINLNDLLNNWDPEKHEAMMQSLFNDDEFYNQIGEDENLDEDQLRELVLKGEDMESLGMGRLPDTKASKKKKGAKQELDPETAEAFAAKSAALKKDVDELRELDTQQLVGPRTTTFRWKQVTPSGFGLTLEEILEKEDRELNAKVSLKKLATYREEGDAEEVMPHRKKRDEKMARLNAKAAKRDAWKKAHANGATPAVAAASSKKKKETPAPAAAAPAKPAAAAAAGGAADAPLSAAQKRRLRKKKLEQLTTAGGTEQEPSAKKQKTEE